MYGYSKTDDTTTNWLYVIKFLSDAYTLQNNTKIDVQVLSAGKLVFKAQYLCFMQRKDQLVLETTTTSTHHYIPNTHNT